MLCFYALIGFECYADRCGVKVCACKTAVHKGKCNMPVCKDNSNTAVYKGKCVICVVMKVNVVHLFTETELTRSTVGDNNTIVY